MNFTDFLFNGTNATTLHEFSAIELVQLYYTPILVYLGTIGNALSMVVFFKTKLKKLSSSYYLASLALSDSVFLLSLFVVWLNMVDVNWFNQHGVCQLMVYLTGACSFLSVWLVLAFTVERFIAVRYPLLRQSVCTVSRAKMIISILVVLSILIFSPLLLFARVQVVPQKTTELCTIDSDFENFATVFNIIDTAVTFVIPVFVIVILNTCISRTIWKLGSVRRKLTYRGALPEVPTHSKRESTKGCRVKPSVHLSQNKITKMLLVVSTVCLCLNFPSYLMRVLTYLIELRVIEDVNIPLFLTVQHCCLQLFNTNFGINFVLYCISGQNFRKAMQSLFCKRRLGRTGTTAFTGGYCKPKNVYAALLHSFAKDGNSG
ncbi:neuropeptides capa receptor-like [Photinus pyralis]|uniref:neuropeptides capa receptor-like n=1 Tax=Photinus pyralis TaxID=7054 RepID=UPI001266EFB6|nr:neuropeptides capa receptor-like [Photinus pyralis]